MKSRLLFLLFTFLILNLNAQIVRSISYKGNEKTKTDVLKKLTSLKKGQILDSIILNSDVKILSRLPVCNSSSFVVEEDEKGDYDVTYSIVETNTIIPTVNFWTANDQQFAYQLGVKEFNFLGENKQIGAFYRNNGFHSFSLEYKDPFMFNYKTGLSLTVQSLTSLEPLFFKDNLTADYKYTNSSVELALIERLTGSHTVNIGFNFFREEYSFIEGDNFEGLPLDVKETKFLTRGIFDYNKLVYDYQYIKGFRSLTNLQYVLPFDKNEHSGNFYMLLNDFFYYKKVKERGNFATRLRLGFSKDNNSPFAPFALDNNLNIRGVGNIIDRGTAVAVLNTEYRHTIIDKDWFVLQTNVFVDAGNWRSPGGKILDVFTNDELIRIHPGIGLRFIDKKIYNAVIRIDYGRSIINGKEKGFVFGVGQYF